EKACHGNDHTLRENTPLSPTPVTCEAQASSMLHPLIQLPATLLSRALQLCAYQDIAQSDTHRVSLQWIAVHSDKVLPYFEFLQLQAITSVDCKSQPYIGTMFASASTSRGKQSGSRLQSLHFGCRDGSDVRFVCLPVKGGGSVSSSKRVKA